MLVNKVSYHQNVENVYKLKKYAVIRDRNTKINSGL